MPKVLAVFLLAARLANSMVSKVFDVYLLLAARLENSLVSKVSKVFDVYFRWLRAWKTPRCPRCLMCIFVGCAPGKLLGVQGV